MFMSTNQKTRYKNLENFFKNSLIWAIESLQDHFIFDFSIFNFSFWRNLASKRNGCDFR